MDTKTLQQIGLNETQSKAYIVLVKNGSVTPPQLASDLKLTRPNAYAVLDQLVECGLANKKDIKKKITYFAENPIALERLAKEKRKVAMEQERVVQNAMPTLLNYFYTFSEQPGVRFFQGIEGIEEIYNDTLRTCKDIYVIRSPHDQDLMSLEFYSSYKRKRAKLGIKTYMLNPSNDIAVWNSSTDKEFNIERTKVAKDAYTSEVEISAYGDKVAIISFGEEALGMIIDSPQISNSFRQIFMLAKVGALAP